MTEQNTEYKGIVKYHASGILIGGIVGAAFGALLTDKQAIVISALIGVVAGEIIALALHMAINSRH